MRAREHDVDPLFIRRWSPRAFTGEPLAQSDVLRLMEAARWAPSSGNNQPWRFVYGVRGTPAFDRLLDLLVEANRIWCKDAGALFVVISKDTRDYNGQPSRTHSYDAGAAWMAVALQATLSGLAAHGMEGFDYERARTELGVPAGYSVEAMIAVGRQGDPAKLDEKYRAREQPNDRRPIGEIMFEGRMGEVAPKG